MMSPSTPLVPAKAGTQQRTPCGPMNPTFRTGALADLCWLPAFAGMSGGMA